VDATGLLRVSEQCGALLPSLLRLPTTRASLRRRDCSLKGRKGGEGGKDLSTSSPDGWCIRQPCPALPAWTGSPPLCIPTQGRR